MPTLWALAGTRWRAGATVLAYQAAGAAALPAGVAGYYGATRGCTGLFLWAAASLAVAGAWAAAWSVGRRRRCLLGIPLGLLATGIPPIGIVGWCHPLTAAGALFPCWGWWGLLATAALPVISALAGVGGTVALTILLLGAGAARAPAPSAPPAGWRGLNTHFGSPGAESRFAELQSLAGAIGAANAPTVVLPETVAGPWLRGEDQILRQSLRPGRTILIGAEAWAPGGARDNALVEITDRGWRVAYRQRMPVPVSMWRPWGRGGVRAAWWGNPVVDVAGEPAGVLICYEELLVWPVLESAACRPRALIGISNDWWCPAGSAIPAVQEASLESWARLFDLRAVIARNR